MNRSVETRFPAVKSVRFGVKAPDYSLHEEAGPAQGAEASRRLEETLRAAKRH